jgi:peptidoglycan/xylan/chitin deacetylase (PgdA/CDA1 family)
VCLTFDDGPHPVHTPVLLDRLRALGLRATFFVVGRNAEKHPDLVVRMAAEGHEVGGHSYTHGNPEFTSALELFREIRRTNVLLERLLGQRPRLFRPPHGRLTAGKMLGAWAARQTVVLWNRDPRDFASYAMAGLSRWFAEAPLAGGDIVLLHDVHPHAGAVLPTVVARLERLGLGTCTVSEFCRG